MFKKFKDICWSEAKKVICGDTSDGKTFGKESDIDDIEINVTYPDQTHDVTNLSLFLQNANEKIGNVKSRLLRQRGIRNVDNYLLVLRDALNNVTILSDNNTMLYYMTDIMSDGDGNSLEFQHRPISKHNMFALF
ncbi:hypothetical protein Btru_040983 [Bulinus truncatus]|nr:hypothetical protein Btru_040983 [Bulinus truncatus]